MRSIESSRYAGEFVSEALWDALSPVGADAVILCPRLESISLFVTLEPASPLKCLSNCKIAGFGLRHLKSWGVDDRLAKELSPLVEVLHVVRTQDDSVRRVRPASAGELDHVLTILQVGNPFTSGGRGRNLTQFRGLRTPFLSWLH